MSGRHYLPRAQDKFAAWSVQFNNYIAAHAQELDLTQQDVMEYNDKHTAMMVAMAILRSPSTRGPARTQAKNDAMAAVRRAARTLAQRICANRNVTATQRMDMQLPLGRPGGRRPATKPPRTAPNVYVKALNGEQLEVQLRDVELPTSRAKPRGVSHAQILMYLGDDPPKDDLGWRVGGMATRTRYVLQLRRAARAGMIVWVTARWVSTRAQAGPLATPACTMVPLGITRPARRVDDEHGQETGRPTLLTAGNQNASARAKAA